MNQIVKQAFKDDMVVMQEHGSNDDHVVLFRTQHNPLLAIALFAQTWDGKWKLQGGIDRSDLRRSGPVAYWRADKGMVTEAHGLIHAKMHVIYGEVYDDRLKWVEIRLEGDEGLVQRCPVVNSTWMCIFPDGYNLRHFGIRAGFGSQELYSATHLQ